MSDRKDSLRCARVARIIALFLNERRATGAQLAAHFEVSRRTIYRDMKTIISAGLPIRAVPGDGFHWSRHA